MFRSDKSQAAAEYSQWVNLDNLADIQQGDLQMCCS
jgi:hypothetical protein